MAKMQVRLRAVTEADLDQLVHISRETFTQTFDAHVPASSLAAFLGSAYAPNQLAAELADANCRFVFAQASDGVVAGYLKVKLDAQPDDGTVLPDPGELQRIYVLADWKGLGIGQLLMAEALRQLRSAMRKTMWLGVWEHNAAAIGFYHQQGFIVFGQHGFAVGEQVDTDLLMQRPL